MSDPVNRAPMLPLFQAAIPEHPAPWEPGFGRSRYDDSRPPWNEAGVWDRAVLTARARDRLRARGVSGDDVEPAQVFRCHDCDFTMLTFNGRCTSPPCGGGVEIRTLDVLRSKHDPTIYEVL